MTEQSQGAVSLRTGARRLIPRWEFAHLRALGYAPDWRCGGADDLWPLDTRVWRERCQGPRLDGVLPLLRSAQPGRWGLELPISRSASN